MNSPTVFIADNAEPNPFLSITLFENDKNPYGKRHDSDWQGLCSFFQRCALHTVKSKKELQLLKLATFRENHRSNETVQLLYGIEGDYDAGEITIAHAIELLKHFGVEAFIYTTSSHTEEFPRFRIVCPFSKPMPPHDHNLYVAQLNGVLCGILAPESFTLSQSYYIGSVEGCSPMQCYHVHGKLIDTVQNLPSIGYRSTNKSSKRLSEGKKAPNYELALEALQSRHPSYGERNWWLAISGAFFTATEGLVSGDVALRDWQTWNEQYGDKNDSRENLSTWRDFKRNGTKGDFSTLAEMSDSDNAKVWAIFGDYQSFDQADVSKCRQGFQLVRADQFKIKPQKWLVDKIIPENSLNLFFGPTASAKTFGAISLGLSVATGFPWYGQIVEKSEVIYICGEGKSGIKKRLDAWSAHFEQSLAEAPFYVSGSSVDFANPACISEIKREIGIQGIKPALIIIDTLSRNTSGDENDSKEMAAFIKALDNLKDEYGASVLLVHHTGHEAKDRARGSSVLKAAMDSEFQFKRENGHITFSCTKMKDSDEPRPTNFELKPVFVSVDNFPQPSAVLVQIESAPPLLSPQNQEALRMLQTHEFRVSKDQLSNHLIASGVMNAKPENYDRIIRKIIGSLNEGNYLPTNFKFTDDAE